MMRLKSPLVMQIELTSRCNHHCVHCYNFWRTEDYLHKPISSEELINSKKIADRIIDGEVFYVTLSGGEPLLFLEKDLEEIIKKYVSYNVGVGLNSNLTLANENHAAIFREYGVTILASVISCEERNFDKVTKRNGSFKRFVKKSRLLSAKGIYLSANMVVDKTRLHQVYETGKFVADLGYKGFNATRLSPSNSGMITDYPPLVLNNEEVKEMLDQLLAVQTDFGLSVGTLNALPYCCVSEPEKYKQFLTRGCVAGLTTAGVSAQGEVRACQHFNINYGSLLNEELSAIWQRIPVWKEFYSDEECHGCVYRNRCSGGCRENAFRLEGSINGKDNLKVRGNNKITKRWDGEQKNIESIVLEEGLKVREEDFGGVLFKNPARYVFVDKFTFLSLSGLISRKVISKLDFLEIGFSKGINEQYIDTVFSGMVNNRVAKIVGGGD